MVIGIFGGIGSGKSVVSRILRLLGEEVYDCDREARFLMERDKQIIKGLKERYGDDIYDCHGHLDRRQLAERLFKFPDERSVVNSLVHGKVREDITRMGIRERIFVESAIPVVSGLVDLCDVIWEVKAPFEIRLKRVLGRGGISEDEVRARINAQRGESDFGEGKTVDKIDNTESGKVLERVTALLEKIKKKDNVKENTLYYR